MSTFQLARDLVEWSSSFSEEERASCNFTFDDILPVAGSHRKLLLHALENIKPAPSTERIVPHDEDLDLPDSERHIRQLESLTSHKHSLLSQLQVLDAQISDCEERHAEEELRADRFYTLIDEQDNIAQFVGSLLKKSTGFCQSPPLAATLVAMTEEATLCAGDLPPPSTDRVSLVTSKPQNVVGAINDGSVAAQDSVIDSYLSVLKGIEETIVSRTCAITDSKVPDCDNMVETLSNSQLLKRLDMQAAQRESLLESIAQEEARITRLTSDFTSQSMVSINSSKDIEADLQALTRTTEGLREEISLKSQRNADLESQLTQELHEVCDIVGPGGASSSCAASTLSTAPSLASSVHSLHRQCVSLPDTWRERTEMLRQTPGWRLHRVEDTTVPSLSPSARALSDCTVDDGTDNETTGGGHFFGIEHLLSGAKEDDKVCFRDSVEKRSQDFRSQFRSITAAAGISSGLTLSDTLQQLALVRQFGADEALNGLVSQPLTTPGRLEEEDKDKDIDEGNGRGSCLNQLVLEIRRLSECVNNLDNFWSESEIESSACSSEPSALTLVRRALQEREVKAAAGGEICRTLSENYQDLSDRENALEWALRDRYDSYTAAPHLVEALALSLPTSSAADVDHNEDGDNDLSGEFGGKLTSMSLKDVLNCFRESHGLELLV